MEDFDPCTILSSQTRIPCLWASPELRGLWPGLKSEEMTSQRMELVCVSLESMGTQSGLQGDRDVVQRPAAIGLAM